MANTFKNASAILAVTSTDIYQCPALTEVVAFGVYATNINGTVITDVTFEVYDNSTTSTKTLGLDLPIPIGSTLAFGKVVLEENDILRAKSTLAASVEVFINILEIS